MCSDSLKGARGGGRGQQDEPEMLEELVRWRKADLVSQLDPQDDVDDDKVQLLQAQRQPALQPRVVLVGSVLMLL